MGYREIPWEQRERLSNESWVPLVEVEASVRYHVYVGAKEGIAYQFAVSVRNVAGYGALSPASNTFALHGQSTSHHIPAPARVVDLTVDAAPTAVQAAIGAGERD